MKKIFSFILAILLVFCIFQLNVNAASIPLNSVTVDVSKEKVAPGEEVTVNINFGTNLGAYTFDVAYDNSIFEYVSAEGGTPNDNGTRVRVTYYDTAGGTNPRINMSVTFKAKADITSTNPTDFSVTAEGLANNDASQEYDDITTPIKKDVTVEPNYVDYTIEFNHSGKLIADEENTMELITKSSMGRNYDHVKMQVEVTKKPSDSATVQLLAIERTRAQVDLIQDGWGEPDGYELGGKDVEQILDVQGVFSEVGEYIIKISLLDKDSSNAVIATKDFTFKVEKATTGGTDNEETTPPENSTGDTNNGNQDNNNNGQSGNQNNNGNNEQNGNGSQNNNQGEQNENVEEMPEKLPQTGMTKYVYIITAIAILGAGYITLKNEKIKNKK